jgi:hypothetical protein
MADSVLLDASQIRPLLNNTTWKMVSHGTPMYWDWHPGGTMCARNLGAQRTVDCIDEGRWHFQGDDLCWKLTWFGKSYLWYENCVTIKKASIGATFEARRAAARDQPQTFFELTIVE